MISSSHMHAARLDVHGVERRAPRHEEAVALRPAEADVRKGLRGVRVFARVQRSAEGGFFGVHLGAIAPRGERGLLILNLDALLRVSSNPFFPYLMARIEEGVTPAR